LRWEKWKEMFYVGRKLLRTDAEALQELQELLAMKVTLHPVFDRCLERTVWLGAPALIAES